MRLILRRINVYCDDNELLLRNGTKEEASKSPTLAPKSPLAHLATPVKRGGNKRVNYYGVLTTSLSRTAGFEIAAKSLERSLDCAVAITIIFALL